MIIFYKDDYSGLADKDGKIILPMIYNNLYKYEDTYYTGKDFFTAPDKIQHMYAGVFPFSEGLAPFRYRYKLGFINRKVKIIIDNKFDEVTAFYKDAAAVKIGNIHEGLWGFINKKGEYTCDPIFTSLQTLYTNVFLYNLWTENGIACVEKNEKYLFVDCFGKNVFDKEFFNAGCFSNGFAAFSDGQKYGYLNTLGEVVIKPEFDCADTFNNSGTAPVCIGDYYGLIDKTGKVIVEPMFEDMLISYRGFYDENDYNDTYRIFYKDGTEIINDEIESLRSRGDEIAAVKSKKTEKFGIIDSKGNFIAQPIYDDIQDFFDGSACAVLNDEYGIISIDTDFEFKPLIGEMDGYDLLSDNKTKAFKFKKHISFTP